MEIISFDLDETLVKRNLIDRFWFEEVPKLYAEKHGLGFEEAVKQVKKSYNDLGPEDVRWYQPSYWFDRFGLDKDSNRVIENLSDEVEYFEDALDVLDRLFGNYDLIVVTNASREFVSVQLSDVRDYFSKIFSCTSDFGEVKKDSSVYERVCEILDVEPSELVHVGDDVDFDYTVPRKAGIRTFLVNRKERNGSEENVIGDLRELLDKL